MLEIQTHDAFDNWLKTQSAPAAIQALDLRSYKTELKGKSFHGSIFLSCKLCREASHAIVKGGGIIVPDSPKLTFPTHRRTLYSVESLFRGYKGGDAQDYKNSYDYQVYQEFLRYGKLDTPLDVGLFRYLHDHSITDALYGLIKGRKVVAIMGGHGMERRSVYYRKIAKLSRRLTQAGFLMVSGGGPGAMEATHFGAYFAARPEAKMLEALEIMGKRPKDAPAGKEYDDNDWLQRAWEIRKAYPQRKDDKEKFPSIGIPTWLYGHEPPAPFATHIAKYFSNSIREDGLLLIARHGVIFAPGSAGTRQEIFQDAAQNHYGTAGYYSPMIMLGKDYWTGKDSHEYSYPVWPLLEATAAEHYKDLVAITDDETEIEALIKGYDPKAYKVR